MINLSNAAATAALLVLGVQAVAQAPATPPASKPISTSLGMVVLPAKGQTAQQQPAASNEQMNLFNGGFAACLEPKGYTVK